MTQTKFQLIINKLDSKTSTNETRTMAVNSDEARLDRAICMLLSDTSRSRIQRAIKDNHVTINGIIVSDCAYKIKPNDIIEVQLLELLPTHMCETEMPLNIVFEDDDILVINKPSGLTVHPGAGNHQDTLANALLYYSKSLSNIGGHFRPGIVHRLDKDTSGLMIIAKNNEAHINLATQIEKRDFIRKYKALSWGMINPASGVIQCNIGRDRNSRQKMSALKSGGKIAITEYSTKEIFLGGLISLIECKLKTGRTHQIRVHLNYLGHSIIGDQTYGNNNRKINNLAEDMQLHLTRLKRQALHSYYLGFIHPRTDKFLEFEVNMPQDIQIIIDNIKS